MGASESKILANNILSACEEAERNGEDELDKTRFWENQETIRVSKMIFHWIPDTIRRSRQPAIKTAISKSSRGVPVPQIIQDLQGQQESLFPTSENEASGPELALGVKHHPRNCTTSFSQLYDFVIQCERQEQLGKIRLRILYVIIFRLKDIVQTGSRYQYDDTSLFIAHMIKDAGSLDTLPIIEGRVRVWVGLGERYSLIAKDLGGLGALYLLPEGCRESIWTKELPKAAKNPNRIAMMKHLGQLELPAEANHRNLHVIAEEEVAKILGPMKALLVQVMENRLSTKNGQRAVESGKSYEYDVGRNEELPASSSRAASRTGGGPSVLQHRPADFHSSVWQPPVDISSANQITLTNTNGHQDSPSIQSFGYSSQSDQSTISTMHPCTFPQFILPTSIDTVIPSTSPQYFFPTSINAEGQAYPDYRYPAVDIVVSSNFPQFTPSVSDAHMHFTTTTGGGLSIPNDTLQNSDNSNNPGANTFGTMTAAAY